MTTKMIILLCVANSLFCLAGSPAKGGDSNQRIERPVRESINTRQATQKKEEQWRLEKEKLVARLEQLQQEHGQLERQKEELLSRVRATQGRVAAKEKQLADIEQISSRIRPFLDELILELQSLISDGLPFLKDERRQRIDRLKSVMADPDISISEKYRKVMEALLVEAEFGFTIEAYQETITVEGKTMLADIFRLGRVSLFYQTLDRKHCGFYNVAERGWQSLPLSLNREIQAALDIAAKRRPVELLTLPVGRMVTR
jgi:hypothetical protein